MMKWWWGMKKGRKREACDLGDSHRIQTCNLLIRSQMLYSVELASRAFAFVAAKLRIYFYNSKEN